MSTTCVICFDRLVCSYVGGWSSGTTPLSLSSLALALSLTSVSVLLYCCCVVVVVVVVVLCVDMCVCVCVCCVVLSFWCSLERIIDDWVFLCMLVGNDFIPHLPTLDISESGLDTLFSYYRSLLETLDGYLTFQGEVAIFIWFWLLYCFQCGLMYAVWGVPQMIPERVEMIFKKLGEMENQIFQQRLDDEEEFNARK